MGTEYPQRDKQGRLGEPSLWAGAVMFEARLAPYADERILGRNRYCLFVVATERTSGRTAEQNLN